MERNSYMVYKEINEYIYPIIICDSGEQEAT